MIINRKMEKQELAHNILQYQWYVVFAFCAVFGVIAMDRFQRLRDAEEFKLTGIPSQKVRTDLVSKICVSIFVCALVHGYYEYRGGDPRQEWKILLLASFLHYHVASFILYRVWPLIKASLTGGRKND